MARSSSPKARGAGPRGPGKKLAAKAEKLHAKAEKLQTTLEKSATKTKAKADKLEQLAARLEALDVWWREQPGQRQARFTRSELARAAIRVIDAEGFDALSMRRLAAEVGAGTMTLYHYVRNKDELLTLVSDEVMAEVLLPDGASLPPDWREALVLIAGRSRAAMHRHPWVLDIPNDVGFGPNAIKHVDETLQAVADLDIPLRTKLDVVVAVDEYVFGYCLQERAGTISDSQKPAMTDYVVDLVRNGDYPQFAAYLDELGADGMWQAFEEVQRDESRFERNLRRFLDGIAADLGL